MNCLTAQVALLQIVIKPFSCQCTHNVLDSKLNTRLRATINLMQAFPHIAMVRILSHSITLDVLQLRQRNKIKYSLPRGTGNLTEIIGCHAFQ